GAVRDVQHVWAEVFDRIEALGKIGAVAGRRAALLEREVLQLALAGLIANWTIERMVDEQELEDAGARASGRRGLRVHHHALGGLRGARDRELGLLLDLDETHATH